MSGKRALAEPARGFRRPMRVEQPEAVAFVGDHFPVIALAAAPGRIVEPPFGRDAFGAAGAMDTVIAPPPAEGLGQAWHIRDHHGFRGPHPQRAGFGPFGPVLYRFRPRR